MFRKLKDNKAQNTAEYAILIALVIGGVVAMQTYAQRALQGRIRDASVFLKNETSALGETGQYEPYYLNTKSTTQSDSKESYTQNGQNSVTNVVTEDKDDTVVAPSGAGNE